MVRRLVPLLATGFLTLATTGALAPVACTGVPPEAPEINDSTARIWADSILGTLSLPEKLAQSFMVMAYSKGNAKEEAAVRALVTKQGVGGVIFFQGSALRQAQLTNQFQAEAKIPLLVGVDAEWGLSMRLKEVPALPQSMALAATRSPVLAYREAQLIAQDMRRIGANVNFAPVADVNSDPRNPVIGFRAYSDTNSLVEEFATAYTLGLLEGGVLPCPKHFPGHGNTSTDSHHALPFIDDSLEELQTRDLAPFRRLIEVGTPMLMVAHIEVPALGCQPGQPASHSREICTHLIRDSLQFDGLVVTDALNMQGAGTKNGAIEVNLKAYQAGADILLCPERVKESIARLAREVRRGRISQARVDQTCRRILMAKFRLTGGQVHPVREEGLTEDLQSPAHTSLSREIANAGITVLRDASLPLSNTQIRDLVYVSMLRTPDHFASTMQYFCLPRKHVSRPEWDIPPAELAETVATGHQSVVICLNATGLSPKTQFGLSPEAIDFARACARKCPTTVVVFGTPYALEFLAPLTDFAGVVMAYGTSAEMQRAAANVVFGGQGAEGVLPVSVPPGLRRGEGIPLEAGTRLGLASGDEVGARAEYIAQADSLGQLAVKSLATPGLQVLAAVRGRVFYSRNFGQTTYSIYSPPVNDSVLYDVASITKIAATTPVVMRLIQEKKLSLQVPISSYIPEWKGKPLGRVTLAELLLHQSGLKPYAPFYLQTMENLWPDLRVMRYRAGNGYNVAMGGNAFIHQNARPRPECYKTRASEDFPIPVGIDLWGHKSLPTRILQGIVDSELEPKKPYVYSDWNFIILQQIVERVTGRGLDQLADSLIFRPLGMRRTRFTPARDSLQAQCAPTEDDVAYRRNVVQGYSHDRICAMMGGVAGHAGLFSTAWDLAKLGEMLRRGGTYGGEEILNQGVVTQFTQAPVGGGYRGYGFDKRNPRIRRSPLIADSISFQSYGHVGFTGTVLWIDPANDFVFVLLSNRTYPDATNPRLNQLRLRAKMMNALLLSVKP